MQFRYILELDLFLQASCKKKLHPLLKKVLKKVCVSVSVRVFYQMQQKEAEIVSVFVWSKLKAFICHNLKALWCKKRNKALNQIILNLTMFYLM